MTGRVVVFILFFLSAATGLISAQNDSLTYSADLYYLGATQDFQPHWQIANRYGIFERYTQNEFVGLFGLGYQYRFNRKFKFESELQYNIRSDISTSYFQQLYFNLFYGSLQLKIGKQEYTVGQYSDALSVGSLFLSNNAKPLTRFGIGFFNYTPVPWVGKYVEFRGFLNFSIMNDDRSEYSGTENPWFHEKFFYLRSKSLPVNIHAGLNHSAFFGGTTASGTQIPVDLLATLFAQSSAKVGGGEEINVAGAHFGLYDFGLNWESKRTKLQLYYQIPFSDGSGKKFNSKDNVIGLLYNNKGKSLISSAIYEYINTKDQSGNGTPDPIVNGKLVVPSQIEDLDQFMLDNFDTVTVGLTLGQFNRILEHKVNYGYEFNGRDDHYNNYLYPAGLTYQGEALGNSLLTHKKSMKLFDIDFDGTYDYYFVNNRIVAHHLAFEGYFTPNLKYRTKLTYSKNYGSYAGANKGRYNWGSIEDPEYYDNYYFKDGLKQAYTFFELTYSPFRNQGASFVSSLAYDFGEMYHDFGILFGFKFNGFVSLRKKASKPQD